MENLDHDPTHEHVKELIIERIESLERVNRRLKLTMKEKVDIVL